MKQYLISIYQPDGGTPPPEVLEKVMQEMDALVQEVKDAGAWVFNGGLHAPSTATVLQSKEDEILTTDGPYVEGKEHLGGFIIVKSPDLDSALEWGRKVARVVASLSIEVRPFHGEYED